MVQRLRLPCWCLLSVCAALKQHLEGEQANSLSTVRYNARS